MTYTTLCSCCSSETTVFQQPQNVDVNLFYYAPVVVQKWTNQRQQTLTCKQLVQGCYAIVWMGVEPTTFELQGRTLSTEPQRPAWSTDELNAQERPKWKTKIKKIPKRQLICYLFLVVEIITPAIINNKKPTNWWWGKMPRHYNSTQSRMRRHFRLFFRCSFRSEVVSDVISSVVLNPTGVKVRVKFGDSWSNRSRDIRLPHFVTNDNDNNGVGRRTAFCLKSD